jgi:hypothetical protein
MTLLRATIPGRITGLVRVFATPQLGRNGSERLTVFVK